MYPEICKIGPFTVYSYGLTLVIAFFLCAYLTRQQAGRSGFNPDVIYNFCFTVFIAGVIGARFFYVIENLSFYRENPAEIIMLQKGGLSWYGGLITGIIITPLYLKKKRLSIYRTLDLIIPFVALAQAIGRIGCLLNGCCFGRTSAYGIYFPVHGKVLIPTQLISSLILLAIFVCLRLFQDKPHKEGKIFFLYLFFYSIKRFCIEFWRSDNPPLLFNLTLFQAISLALFCLSLLKLISLHKENLKKLI